MYIIISLIVYIFKNIHEQLRFTMDGQTFYNIFSQDVVHFPAHRPAPSVLQVYSFQQSRQQEFLKSRREHEAG